MPKWVQNVLWGIGICLATWLFYTDRMIAAGILTFVMGIALAFTAGDNQVEKPE